MQDVVVIGGGPGGYAAAIRASQLGGKVALVEGSEIGGTCVNRGCVPSKIWLRAVQLLEDIERAGDFGIRVTMEEVVLKDIVERKNGIARDIRMGMEGLLGNNNVELVHGSARLKSPREVSVGDRILECKRLILATGSALEVPDIPGIEEAALTTDQVLDMEFPPSSVLIWGAGGAVEVEMAALLCAFGSKVILSTELKRILQNEDGDTGQRISQALREKGVEILTGFSLKSVKKSKNGTGWLCDEEGVQERSVTVEKVLISKRKPRTGNLGLGRAGVSKNEDGSIQIDEKLETTQKGIYAVGDATGGRMLSHMASSMAVVAAENAMGYDKTYPRHLVPRGIWTIPQVGAVGLSEEEAEKQGIDFETGDFPYSINGLAMCRGELSGAVKVVTDARYGGILGVHIVGSNATELVGEAVTAMQLEATVNELAASIRVHPTFSESIVDAARDARDWALYLPKR